ncbi:MAG TPA: arsenical pump-driving ATPase, partial [Rhodoferax sp.]|nr:arsenical pump-driving ATPase [Rhodoferax sp.]
WVINKSVLAAGTTDPVLRARLEGERKQMARISSGLASRTFVVAWKESPPIGYAGLADLVSG